MQVQHSICLRRIFHNACLMEDTDLIKYLYDRYKDSIPIDCKRIFSDVNLNIIKFLYDIGINMNIDKCCNSIIMDRIEHNDLEALQFLSNHGANLDGIDEFIKKIAVERGYLDIIKYLSNHGADFTFVTEHSINSFNAIEMALINNKNDTVKYLCKLGIDIHYNNDELLRYVIGFENLDMVQFLLSMRNNCSPDIDIAWVKSHCSNQIILDEIINFARKIPKTKRCTST